MAGQKNERDFLKWYKNWANISGIDPNPDNPLHKYDYRSAYRAEANPQIDPGDGLYHWPSEFKFDDHPNRFVDGVDTKTGEKQNWEAYEEANKRGILSSDKKALYNEAKKRGLIPDMAHEQPTGQDPLSLGGAAVSGIKNLPKSLYGVMGDMLYTLNPMNWKQVAGAMVDATLGAVEKVPGMRYMTPGPAYDIKGVANKRELAINALTDHYKKTYGTWEGFKRQLADDPANMFMDVASIALPASKAAGLSKLTKTSKALGTVAEVTEPLSLAMKVARQPFRLVPDKFPSHMYQSAVKFGTTLSISERKVVVGTALKNQIMPTTKGMEKLRGMIDNYNKSVNTMINSSSMTGRVIPLSTIYNGVEPILKQMKRMSDEPRKIDLAWKQMKKEWETGLDLGQMRTPTEIQKIKTTIYKDLASFYEQHKASPAKVTLRKAVAKNARESLEKIIPEIKQLNKNEGELIALWDAIESKANRITNRDFVSIGLPIKMGAGSGIGYM
ncbi:MAG: hypothetical protein GY774_35760, partial [Planctomycetes bacterium]|nr:hypothetical protein [Planctomycetota bacterium]